MEQASGVVRRLRRRWARGAPPRALVRYAYGIRPASCAALGVFILAGGLLPVAFAVVSGHLVGSVPDAVAGGPGSAGADRLQWLMAVTAVVFVARQVIAPLRLRLGWNLGLAVEGGLRSRVMDAASTPPGIGHLEDPAVLDRIALARGIDHGYLNPIGAIESLGNVATRYVTSTGSFVVIWSWRWWVAIAIVVAYTIFVTRCRDHFRSLVQVMVGETETFRRADYVRDLALTPPAAKEIRVFRLGGWLAGRYEADVRGALADVWRMRARFSQPFLSGQLLASTTRAVALVMVGHAGARGHITLTEAVALVGALTTVAEFTAMGDDDLKITQGSAPVPAVLRLEHDVRGAVGIRAAGTAPADGLPRHEIRFEGVTFAYPGGEPVFDGLDLTIAAGRSLAVVGINGAGKTTLIKLLARLYDPLEGRILVDGADLRDLDAASWQRRIAAIFQDFVHYELPAADNIGFGAPQQGGDRDAIERAAEAAG